jgi:hypothetical protein
MLLSLNGNMLFEFKPDSNISNWRIVDDVVMGGRSEGNFFLSKDGVGVFTGNVSLENNGGFSSVRHRFEPIDVSPYSKVIITLKGDGKRYQFRAKTSKYDRHSYITYFETTGEWQTLEIPLKDMYPSWRGMKLDMPNYPGESMEEIAFLIANYKAEQFRLEIKEISFN